MLTTAIIVWLAFNVAFVAVRLMVTAPQDGTPAEPTPAERGAHLRLVA